MDRQTDGQTDRIIAISISRVSTLTRDIDIALFCPSVRPSKNITARHRPRYYSAPSVACLLIGYKLDYRNSPVYLILSLNIQRLQSVQNLRAPVVMNEGNLIASWWRFSAVNVEKVQ